MIATLGRCTRSLVAAAAVTLCLAGGWARAQTVCVPATTPCQTCPAPPACVPSSTPCGASSTSGTTFTTSTVSCPGPFAQHTFSTSNALGPTNICIGPEKSIGCFVPAGTQNVNVNDDAVLGASTAGVPTLSVWGLIALAAGLGAVALLCLAAPSR